MVDTPEREKARALAHRRYQARVIAATNEWARLGAREFNDPATGLPRTGAINLGAAANKTIAERTIAAGGQLRGVGIEISDGARTNLTQSEAERALQSSPLEQK